MPSSFFTKTTLKNLYFLKKQSTYDIGKKFHCDSKTVYYWLKKYSIPTRIKKTVPIKKENLLRLYRKGLSLHSIGNHFGINASAVYRKMQEFNLSRRRPWEANIRHERKNFSKNNIEKSYLLGFRIGDLHVAQNASSVIVKSNTTHRVQVELMKKLFSPYGPCWISTPKTRKNIFHCSIALNKSFRFLVAKPLAIPKWILQSNCYFLAFLAGYIDAEGTIKIYSNRARLRIGSYDKIILQEIHQKLASWDVKNSFRLEGKADYVHRNGNFYRVDIMDKTALYVCLSALLPHLKHNNRRHDAHAALTNVTKRITKSCNPITIML